MFTLSRILSNYHLFTKMNIFTKATSLFRLSKLGFKRNRYISNKLKLQIKHLALTPFGSTPYFDCLIFELKKYLEEYSRFRKRGDKHKGILFALTRKTNF